MREKVGKSRNSVFFQWFVAPEGRKVGSLKRRVRSQLARGEIKNCTPLWREAHFQVRMHKTHQVRTTFGTWDVEKVHAVVARSTFRSENVQNTIVGPLLEVEMSKKCTQLWREAHFQVKMLKALGVRTTFGRSDLVSRGKRKGLCTVSKVSKTWWFCSIFNYNTTTPHYTPIHYTTLQLQLHLHYILLHCTPLHSTTLHCTQLHSITLQLQLHNYTPLHSTRLHYIPLHYTTLHYTTLHYTTLHYTTLLSTTLHYMTLNYTPLHYTTTTTTTTLHYTPLHSTTLNYTTLHYITLHYIPLHSTTLHYLTLNDTAPQIDR